MIKPILSFLLLSDKLAKKDSFLSGTDAEKECLQLKWGSVAESKEKEHQE